MAEVEQEQQVGTSRPESETGATKTGAPSQPSKSA